MFFIFVGIKIFYKTFYMRKAFCLPLIIGFCGIFTFAKAQTPKEEPLSSAKSTTLKEDALKARNRKNELNQANKKQLAAKNNIIVKNTIDENDIYMGRKAEFLGNLTISELPADFPKYDKSYGLRYYNNLVDNYYGSHKDILKPKVREKIEYHYPSANNKQLNTK